MVEMYFVIIVALAVSATGIAVSLVGYLWITAHCEPGSFVARTAKIFVFWLDMLLCLATSYFVVSSLGGLVTKYPLFSTFVVFVAQMLAYKLAAGWKSWPVILISVLTNLFATYYIWSERCYDDTRLTAMFFMGIVCIAVMIVFAACNCFETPKENETVISGADELAENEEPESTSAFGELTKIVEHGAQRLEAIKYQ